MSSHGYLLRRLSSVAAIALLPFVFVSQTDAQTSAQPYGQPSTAKGDWPMYFADPSGSRYSPQDQINASNFNKLEVAWRFKTDNLGARPEYKLEGTPLEINGMVYTTAGSRRAVIALNAKTGELKWVYSLDEGARAAYAPRQLSGRGVSYWTDGNGDDRILYITTGYRLVELNAHTGRPIESFGDHGMVDMKVGAVYRRRPADRSHHRRDRPAHHAHRGQQCGDRGLCHEGRLPAAGGQQHQGHGAGLDVKTGKLFWTFHTIPKKGEFGYDTWENGSADRNGNTGVWTGITVDPELNSVYLPVEDPTNDFYGGARPGNDLFGDSLVCVDLTTGKRKWYLPARASSDLGL